MVGVEVANSMATPWWTSGSEVDSQLGSSACSTESSVEDNQRKKTCDTFDPNPMANVCRQRRTEKSGAY